VGSVAIVSADNFESIVLNQPLIVGSGQVISISGSGSYGVNWSGFLVDAVVGEVVTASSYTVPPNTVLVLLNLYGSGTWQYGPSGYLVSGDFNGSLTIPIVVPSGETVFGGDSLNGYLRDQ